MGWGEYWNPTTNQLEEFNPIAGREYDINENQIGSQSYWKLKNNPMYRAAADALGIDWDAFIADADASVGLEGDWDDHIPNMETTVVGERTMRGGRRTGGESITYNKDAYDAAMEEWGDSTGTDISNPSIYASGFTATIMEAQGMPNVKDFQLSNIPALNQYGFAGNKDIFNQIQEFDSWLTDTSKFQAQHDIIREGPQPSDYGMEGDNIFEALGLDKPSEGPKESDVSYEMNLAEAKPSEVTYQTPSEYKPVNLHE